ncbi:MAG: anti-sigma F factor [Bacillota bacterium]|jgi:stage II sporulation protein AB (anti-sigma F factor)
MAEGNYIKVEFPSLPENVGFSRALVSAFASQLNFTLPELDEIRTATSEAVSNAIIHGYENKMGVVTLEAEIKKGVLTIRIIDHGKGIADIDAAKAVQYSTIPGRYGLGFTFMEAFMDSLDVESELGKGTSVIMTKHPETVCPETGTA